MADRPDEVPEYRCELGDREAKPALAVRRRAAVADLPKVFEETFGAIMTYMAEIGEPMAGMPYGAYHNMDMQDLDVEIGVPVARTIEGRGDIEACEVPGGQWATAVHIGPYDQIGPAYEALMAWMEEHGRAPAGPPYEFYFSGPETPAEEIKTEIGFPLASV